MSTNTKARSAETPHSLRRALIHDMWGEGLTVVKRTSLFAARDQFEIPAHLIPKGMAYQWCSRSVLGAAGDESEMTEASWVPVPAKRHDGWFAPYGYEGDIEAGGLVLMERPKAMVAAAHAETARKAQKNVDDWFERQGSAGFSGSVRTFVGPLDAEPPANAPVRRIGSDTSLHDAAFERRDKATSGTGGGSSLVLNIKPPAQSTEAITPTGTQTDQPPRRGWWASLFVKLMKGI